MRQPFRLAVLLVSGLVALPALAAPETYQLETDRSLVAFQTDFGQDKIDGTMPVTRADLSLDFDKVARSKVAVTLDASAAKASFPFAAQAMRGPRVLATEDYPEISFVSTGVKLEGKGVRVAGKITIRGVTRPISLHAEIMRQKGSVAGDLSHLTIRLTGAVMRSDFGAVGWSDMVGDEVRLDIRALIARAD